jgi:hypothetical protein
VKRILFIFSFLCAFNVSAEGFGFGYCPSFFSMDIDDPDGSTDSASDFNAVGLCAKYDPSNVDRFFFMFERFDFDLDASTSTIGQDIESTQYTLLYQRNLKLSRSLNRFYVGGGGFFGDLSASLRHTIDSDGFLNETFESRDESDFGLTLSVGADWELSESLDLGANAFYQHSLNDGLSGFRVGITLLYNMK